MGLVNLKTILRDSVNKTYAVGAFNATDHSMAEAILEASETKNVPVILSVAEVHFPYQNMEHFSLYLRNRIEGMTTPVALHLDHGLSVATVKRALDLGFSSVMIDASTKPFAENVKITSEVVNLASQYNVSVEAELGLVGGGEGSISQRSKASPKGFTDPQEAVQFVQETGIDALAIAIGTVHGRYEGTPCLDYTLLREIRSLTNIPLVLHGGSGLSDEDFRQAVQCGINKINFFTAASLAASDKVREIITTEDLVGYPDLITAARNRVKEIVMEQMDVFGTQPLNN